MKQPFLTRGICSAFSLSFYRSSIEILCRESSAHIDRFWSCPQAFSLSAWNSFSPRSIVSEPPCPIDSKLHRPIDSKLLRLIDSNLPRPIDTDLRQIDSELPRPIEF